MSDKTIHLNHDLAVMAGMGITTSQGQGTIASGQEISKLIKLDIDPQTGKKRENTIETIALLQKLELLAKEIEKSFEGLNKSLTTMSNILDDIDDALDTSDRQIANLKHIQSALNSKNPNEQEDVLIHILEFSKEEYDAMSPKARHINIIQGYNEKIDVFKKTMAFLNEKVKAFEIEKTKYENTCKALEPKIERLKEMDDLKGASKYQKQLDDSKQIFDKYIEEIEQKATEIRALNTVEFRDASNEFVPNNQNAKEFNKIIDNVRSVNIQKLSPIAAFTKAANPNTSEPQQEIVVQENSSAIEKPLVVDNGGFSF